MARVAASGMDDKPPGQSGTATWDNFMHHVMSATPLNHFLLYVISTPVTQLTSTQTIYPTYYMCQIAYSDAALLTY